jgi:hypothetical protein
MEFNKTARICFLFLISFFGGRNLYAQIDLGFVQHLSENSLRNEHWNYINHTNSSSDSIEYLKAKFYMQYEEDSLFLNSFNKCAKLFVDDSVALNYSHLYFIKKTDAKRAIWFNSVEKNDSLIPNLNEIVQLYKLTENPVESDTSFISEELQVDFLKFSKAFSKKPVLAAFLSAIVPGLGELYIGNFKSFGAKFTSLTIFGLQSAESIYKLGLLKPLPLLNLSFFTAFYGANIVGAYRDTKSKTNEFKDQFLIHVSNYYSLLSVPTLY